MKFVEYGESTDRQMLSVARRRHEQNIRDLSQLGFMEAGVMTETTPPLGAIMHLITLPGQLMHREVFRIRGPLRLVIYQPWMIHPPSGTHAIPFGKGIQLYTGLSDGSGVVTANFNAVPISKKARLHKRSRTMPTNQMFREHCDSVAALLSPVLVIDKNMSFSAIVDLTAREDPAGFVMWVTLLLQTAFGLGLLYYLAQVAFEHLVR